MPSDRVKRGIEHGWIRVRQGDVVKLVRERLRFKNKFIRVFDDDVQFTDKPKTTFLRLTYAKGVTDGSVVVPVNMRDEIILVRQFRHSPRIWMEELPRGFAQPNERNGKVTVERELKEETGHRIVLKEAHLLGRLIPDSGKLHDAPYLVMGRVIERTYRRPDDTEAIVGIKHYKFSALKAKCQSGEIMDMFTLSAVARLEPHFHGDKFVPNIALLRSAERLNGTLTDLRYEDDQD